MSANPPPPGRALGVLTLLLTLAGWSSVPLFLTHFSDSIDAWTSNGWRYGFSALLWSPVIIVGLWRRRLPRGLWKAALVPGLFNAIGQAFFTLSFYGRDLDGRHIDPGLPTFALRANLLFVAAGAAILFPAERRIIRSGGFIGGVALILLGTAGTVVLDSGFGQGATVLVAVYAVVAAFFFACYALAVRHFTKGIPALVSFAAISQYTSIVMISLMLVFGDNLGVAPIHLPSDQIVLLLVSAVIGIALGHVFYYIAIARLGVAVSSGVLQLQPFCVGAASVFLFHAGLSPWQWASGALAVVGAALILLVQHRLTRRRVEQQHLPEPAEFADLPPDHVAAAVVDEVEQPTATTHR